jgi:hypothetical protein
VNLILLIVLLLLVVGALPTWPYSAGWGYYPSGGLGLLRVVPFSTLRGGTPTTRSPTRHRNASPLSSRTTTSRNSCRPSPSDPSDGPR